VDRSIASEQEADRAAGTMMSGNAITVQTAAPIGIARQPLPGSIDLTESASPIMARAIGSVTIGNFALGKADIPPGREAELRQTAGRMVTLLKRYPRSTIRVTGHTDTVGTPERNETLGSDRANAVKDVLLSEGVPEEKIQAQSKGETAPAVSTKDEKPEPRNRRVEVQFDPAQSMLPSMVPDLTLKPKPPAPFNPLQKQQSIFSQTADPRRS
jgi:outer membrane protein OmpA-like peptidoglycan-associated protein